MNGIDFADNRTWAAGAARNRADELSGRLNGAFNLLRLAAFAAEARRTLDEIELALSYRDKVREDLRAHVSHMTNWQDMPDASAEALQFIAQMVEQTQGEFTELAYQLSAQVEAKDRTKAALEAAAHQSATEATY